MSSVMVHFRSMPLDQVKRFADAGYLYALLDSYGRPEVPRLVQTLDNQKAVSLFSGEAQTRYAEVAPYLVQVEEPTLDWIRSSLPDVPWGVLVVSKFDLLVLRAHFQRFLLVELPDGEHWFFRYYDPRILPIYLQNCDERELDIFFGPARAFGVMEPEAKVRVLYTPGKRDISGGKSDASIWKLRTDQVKALQTTRDINRAKAAG